MYYSFMKSLVDKADSYDIALQFDDTSDIRINCDSCMLNCEKRR